MGLLTTIVFAPTVGAAILASLPERSDSLLRRAAVAISLVPFVLSLYAWRLFDITDGGFQFVEHSAWMPSLGVSYSLGIDGISLLLILLTVFLTPLVLVSAGDNIHRREKGYLVSMLLLETSMLGTLAALDLVLFYVFWELMLIPMFLIIGIWGGERRVFASIKFLLFTMAGSLPMLAALIYMGLVVGSPAGHPNFSLVGLYDLHLSSQAQWWCFAALAVGFAVKVPMWPLHTWLPDAHVEAPTGGSVILAGVMLKMGTYGFVRFVLPLFPSVLASSMPWMAALAVVAIIYGALVAMVQPDMKKLVAYSSVSHLGFVMLGIAALNQIGIEGAVYQMLNHGLSTGALFLLVGMIYERRHTRLISEYSGLWKQLPVYAACFLIVMLSSIGLPGLNGFIGEFLILLGAFHAQPLAAGFAVTGVILGAAYMLWLFRRVMFGPLDRSRNGSLRDMSGRELAVIVPVIALIFIMGVYPRPFLATMHASVARIVERVSLERPAVDRTAAAIDLAGEGEELE